MRQPSSPSSNRDAAPAAAVDERGGEGSTIAPTAGGARERASADAPGLPHVTARDDTVADDSAPTEVSPAPATEHLPPSIAADGVAVDEVDTTAFIVVVDREAGEAEPDEVSDSLAAIDEATLDEWSSLAMDDAYRPVGTPASRRGSAHETGDSTSLSDPVSRTGSEIDLSPNRALVKPIRDRQKAGPRFETIGRYDVLSQIGSGAFGFVYEGYDPELHRRVAIKVARMEVADREPLRRLFEQEAEQASRLDHPGIVPIYELGLIDPASDPDGIARPYIVMGFCTGQTLDAWMRANRDSIAPGLAAEFVRQTAEAVGHGHRRGIQHRDLKPGNIMVLESEAKEARAMPTVRVLDFGLSGDLEKASQQSGTRIVAGSAAYMSPEQAAGEPTEATSDVHALGAVLFKLLTGRTPYSEGDGRTRLLDRLAKTTAPSPRTIDITVPTDLAAICMKCLRKNPRQRYANCAELAADLQAYLEGRPTVARVLTPRQELARWLSEPDRIREAGAVLLGIHLFLPFWSIGSEIGVSFVDDSKSSSMEALTGMIIYLVGVTWPLHGLFVWVAWGMFRGRPILWAMRLATNVAVLMVFLHFARGIGFLPLPSPYYATHPGARWQVFWMLTLTALVDVTALVLAQIAERRCRQRRRDTSVDYTA